MLKDPKKYNFLVHIPLEQQIRFLLNKYFDIIVAYVNRDHSNEFMSDIDDGELFKKISANCVVSLFLLFLSFLHNALLIHLMNSLLISPFVCNTGTHDNR